MEDVFLQYGAIGAIALMALFALRALYGQQRATYEAIVERERERADRLEEEMRKLNEMVRSDYISTISRASQAIVDANRAVSDALAAVRKG
jgi:thymidylate kinase